MKNTCIQPTEVVKIFETYPPKIQHKLMKLRNLILQTAAATDGVGKIEETVKWGEPAYLTSETGSGSTIRLGWKKSTPMHYYMYFICTTNLVETFRTVFANDFTFEGNRAIVFQQDDAVPGVTLSFCIAAALTHKKNAGKKIGSDIEITTKNTSK